MTIFVRCESNSPTPGLGKVVSVNGSLATVEYFNSPIDDPIVVTLCTSSLRNVEVAPQTRAYWFDKALRAWRVGRILDGQGDRLAVRFPNGDERLLPAVDLQIRWDKPIVDPAPFLAQFLCETPLFADARSGFVRSLMEQRGASLGMSALLSSAIELEAHQVEVVRRVLQDPVQRYLLADEVGLGKTIEAGVLIRQYVIDDPDDHRVLVLVPPSLVAQWTDELRRRFFLTVNASDGRVRVISTADLAAVETALPGVGMLVLDEAHHLSANQRLYKLLRQATAMVPRLLLLSATPVLRNERGFLEMLHLLDPLVYPLDDAEAFRRRIEHRQSLAEAVAALIPENVLQLDAFLDSLVERFADDPILVDRIAALRRVAAALPTEDDPELLQALAEVRSHLSEIYRLDHRILRNRRGAISGLTPNRAGAVVVWYGSAQTRNLAEAVERWRNEAAHVVYRQEQDSGAQGLARWFADIIDCILAEDHSRFQKLLSAPPANAPPVDELRAASARLMDDPTRLEALLEALSLCGSSIKCVVFCSSQTTADRVAAFLQTTFDGTILRAATEDREEILSRFLERPGCHVLVCDRADEEGLNLQGGAKAIIHYDLPMAPNRIEQRIGRLDRYGSGDSVRSYVLCCSDDPYQQCWSKCLIEAVGAFSRSIASLQYLIDAEMQQVRSLLLTESHEAMSAMTARLGGDAGKVARELRRIDHQDALDALGKRPEDALDELFSVDGKWRDFQTKVDDWLVTCLNMSHAPGPSVGRLPPGDRVGRYALQRDGRHPTLIPLTRFVGTMLQSLDKEAPGSSFRRPLTYAYTARRQTALTRRCRNAGVRLLRYGDILLDGLQTMTSLEDRGRCFAVWRRAGDYRPTGAADAYLRFDFIVETDITKALKLFVAGRPGPEKTAANALRRRGDMLFPPFFHRLWLDDAMQPVQDESLLARLEAPYDPRGEFGHRDTNLNPRRINHLRSRSLSIVREWPSFVMHARTVAEKLLYERHEIEARATNAVGRARADDSGRFARLRLRIAREQGPAAEEGRRRLALEEPIAVALYEGIMRPRVSLDTIGVVFLSDQPFATSASTEQLTED